MGIFKKIKDRFGGGDDDIQHEQESRAEGERSQAGGSPAIAGSSTIDEIVARAEASRGGDSSGGGSTTATAEPVSASASAPSAGPSNAGAVTGSGLDRTYISREGDTLEAIGAYFYGDPAQKQRLIDDNPSLQAYDGKPLPAGFEIKVSEDTSRGDTVST